MVDLVAIHRSAVRARRLHERLTALARAGRIANRSKGVYGRAEGVTSAAA